MSDLRTLSQTEMSAWKPFASVLELLPNGINAALQREVGQPLVNLYVLTHLQQQPSRASGISELAACTSATLPRMSRTIARMEAEGLVERTTCATDGRAVIVRLTEQGEEFLEGAMPHHDRVIRELLIDALSPEQLAQLQDIAATLAARLHPDTASPIDRQRTTAA
jgi:DNA-binding MarR family transcriptional regulator